MGLTNSGTYETQSGDQNGRTLDFRRTMIPSIPFHSNEWKPESVTQFALGGAIAPSIGYSVLSPLSHQSMFNVHAPSLSSASIA